MESTESGFFMSEKTFKLSKNYRRLWELLHRGATVVYRVNQEQIFDEVGLIKNEDCQHIALNVRYTDEDGLKAWRDIDAPTFVSECERLNLQFFDEAEAPEPNRFWVDRGNHAREVTSKIRDVADEIVFDETSKETAAIGSVHCAVYVGVRKIRAWTDKGKTRWEWVDETLTKSTHP